MIKQKSDLERLRENRDGAMADLIMLRKWQGDPVTDANIAHKEAYIRDVEAQIKALEAEEQRRAEEERDLCGEQLRMI